MRNGNVTFWQDMTLKDVNLITLTEMEKKVIINESPLKAFLLCEKASGALFVDAEKEIWFFYGEDKEKFFGEIFLDLISDKKGLNEGAQSIIRIVKEWKEYIPYLTAF